MPTGQDIALELTIQTGQVFTCPDGEHITGTDRAYNVRPFWRDNDFLEIHEDHPKSRTWGESIKCNASRSPEAIARDILNRLPNAAAYYAKREAEHIKHLADMERQRETVEALKAVGLTIYGRDDDTSAQMHKWPGPIWSVNIHSGEIYEAKLSRVSLNQFLQIVEILNNGRQTD